MTEAKTKSAAKKATTAKAGGVIASKPATASKPKTKKTVVEMTAKKAVTKKVTVKSTAAKKTKVPAVKKAATVAANKISKQKAAATQAAVVPAKPVSSEKSRRAPTPEERYRMVETTAYFIAERNGFQGDSTEHWAAAEREIATKLGE